MKNKENDTTMWFDRAFKYYKLFTSEFLLYYVKILPSNQC